MYTIGEIEELEDLGEEIGKGGSATVKKALHRKSNTLVALKVPLSLSLSLSLSLFFFFFSFSLSLSPFFSFSLSLSHSHMNILIF